MTPQEANKREANLVAKMFEVRSLLHEYLQEAKPHLPHPVVECLLNSKTELSNSIVELYKARSLRETLPFPQEKEPTRVPMFHLDNTNSIIDALKFWECRVNGERGVACVQSIISDLERGDVRSAQATAKNEGDKIRAYPRIERIICRRLIELHGELFPCPHQI
jgi:hypothetical protein